MAALTFLAFLGLAMPPLTHTVWNRVEPWLFGLPFFYVVLLGAYTGAIVVLIWALRRGL